MKSDISPVSIELYFLPVETRVPLKFGLESLTSVAGTIMGIETNVMQFFSTKAVTRYFL